MKRDDFSIYDAAEQDIDTLDDWYTFAGGRPGALKNGKIYSTPRNPVR